MSLKHRFRQIKKLPGWIYILPALLLKIYFKIFFRVTYDDPANIRETVKGAVGLAWHNRLLFFPVVFSRHLSSRTVAVISASKYPLGARRARRKLQRRKAQSNVLSDSHHSAQTPFSRSSALISIWS